MKIKSDFYESVRRLALSDWTYDKEIKTHSTSIKTNKRTEEKRSQKQTRREMVKWFSTVAQNHFGEKEVFSKSNGETTALSNYFLK